MLAERQIETYHADGYPVVGDVLDLHEIEALRRETDRIVASRRSAT